MPRILRCSSPAPAAARSGRAAEHRGEQIVEIVGDAAGQLADRVHLAGLEQLLSSALRSVTSSRVPAYRSAPSGRGAAPPDRGNACTGRRRTPAIFDRQRAVRPLAAPSTAPVSGWSRSPRGRDRRPRRSGSRSAPRNCRRRIAAPRAASGLEIEDDRQRLMIAAWRCSASAAPARRSRSALARRLASSSACSCRALRWISRVIVNRSTNTADLGAQHDRLDRLEHIIDRAHRIAAHQMLRFLVDRGEEDDRDALGLLAARG